MNLMKLTPQNAFKYIGKSIIYKTRDQDDIKIINGVSATGKTIYIDNPDLNNCLQIVSRNVYVILDPEVLPSSMNDETVSKMMAFYKI
jgi:predicted AAA+ superfamily ATPase